MRNIRPVEDKLKWVTATLCTYETTAIITGRLPTISTLCARYPTLGGLFVGALAVHLVDHRKQLTRRRFHLEVDVRR